MVKTYSVATEVKLIVNVPVNAENEEEALGLATDFVLQGEFFDLFEAEICGAIQNTVSDEDNVDIITVDGEYEEA